jgi:hypothetical protein
MVLDVWVAAVVGVAFEAPGYAHFKNWDGHYSFVYTAQVSGKETVDLNLSDGSIPPHKLMLDLCAAEPSCTGFYSVVSTGGGTRLLSATTNTEMDMFLAFNASLIGAGKTICSTDGAGLYYDTTKFLGCTCGDAIYRGVIATFQLPPFLLAEACSKNPSCVGFRAWNNETGGDLLKIASGCATTYWKAPGLGPDAGAALAEELTPM